MEKENTNYGNLFGTIDLLSEEHLEIILSTMNNDTLYITLLRRLNPHILRECSLLVNLK